MKKYLLFALMLTAVTAGAQGVQPGELNYEYDEGTRTATVTWNRIHLDDGTFSGYYFNTYSGDIVIPETAPNGYPVVAIGEYAFVKLSPDREGSPTITSVSIPKTVKKICKAAFSDCNLLKEITIPATVEELEGSHIFNLSGITDITIEDSDNPLIVSMGYLMSHGSVFSEPNVRELRTIYVGRDLTCNFDSEANGAFTMAENITDITYGPKVTKLHPYEFHRSSSIQNVNILSTTMTEIPEAAFDACPKLTNITLPNSLESIGKMAFAASEALPNIKMPDGVKTIGQEAFYKCPIKNLVLPAQLENIGPRAFNFNQVLTTITSKNTVPPACEGWPFWTKEDIVAQATLYVPDGCVDVYKAAEVWKEFFIEEMEETKCKTPTATIENGHLKFSCETKGVTFHYEYSYPGGKGEGDDVAISQTLTVSVYATRADLEDSDVAVYDLTIVGDDSSKGDVNGDGKVDVADIATVLTIMARF